VKKTKRMLWGWLLLQKRLLKKTVFWILLILIPILCFCYSTVSQEDSGIVTIALAQEAEDPLASQVINDLADSSQLIRFKICQTPSEAEALVLGGKADAAWIFPAQMQQRLEAFVANPKSTNAFVTVLEQEDNILLLLTHEKLGGTLYDLYAETVYLRYIREAIPEMAEASDEDLLRYYNEANFPSELFLFEQADGTPATLEHSNILTMPVRGLLGVVIVLCGIAAAMYYIQDQNRGTFSWLPVRQRPVIELISLWIAVGDLTLVALISLLVTGLSESILLELITLLGYSLCCSVFCMMLRCICNSISLLGALLPLLVVGMLVICPVFFNLSNLRQLQYLLPPTYYINSVYDPSCTLYMLLYTLVCAGIYLLAGIFRKRP